MNVEFTAIIRSPIIEQERLIDIQKSLKVQGCFISSFDSTVYDPYESQNYLNELDLYNNHVKLLLDRNIFSYLIKIAESGKCENEIEEVALKVLIFAQCSEILIEPNLALYEYASSTNRENVKKELEVFRRLDNTNPQHLVEIAYREKVNLSLAEIDGYEKNLPDFSKQLNSWRFNYTHLLKIAELSRLKMAGDAKFLKYIEWVEENFIFSAPATTLALIIFSDIKKGSIKNINSADKSAVLKSIKNSAWDLTYLTEFSKAIKDSSNDPTVFCSFDKLLLNIAKYLFVASGDDVSHLKKTFEECYGRSGEKLLEKYLKCISNRSRHKLSSDDSMKIINFLESSI